MKKMKMLGSVLVILAVMLVAGQALAKDISIPAYTKEGVTPTTQYYAISSPKIFPISPIIKGNVSKARAQGFLVMRMERFEIDRNEDRKIDLVHMDCFMPEIKYTDKGGNEKIRPEHQWVVLLIDDDFDGRPDRQVVDN